MISTLKYNRIILKLKILVILVFYSLFAFTASHPKFKSVNSLYGISLRNANSICEDNNGFIWASSKTGILRLTDDDYRIYEPEYESADVITVKLAFEHSKLVAYTNNGQIFLYNPVFDRFDLLLNMSKTLENRHLVLFNLTLDDSGAYWISSSSGLYKFQSEELTLIDNTFSFSFRITWLDNRQLVIACPQGIWLYNTNTSQKRSLIKNPESISNSISKLYFDKNKNILWVGTLSDGIFQYDFNTGIFSQITASIPKQPILAIEPNSDSTMLIGIDGQGIWKLDKKRLQVLDVYKENADDPYSLPGNGVYDIFHDSENRIWVCTISGGVSWFNQASAVVNQITHQVNNPSSLSNNEVNDIIEDWNGNLWFATNNGISCWDKSTNHWKNYYHNTQEQAQVFHALCEDKKGRIWAGSYSSGVYVLNEDTGKELAHYAKGLDGPPLISNFILDVFKDSDGDIWIGGVNGQYACYLINEGRFRTFSFEPISSFAEFSPGKILLGCSYGLTMVDKQTGNSEQILIGLLINDLQVIGDNVWICTSGDGLVRFNLKNRHQEKFTTAAGLPSNFVNSIVYVDGYLWIGTESGLCRFNPESRKVLTFSSDFPLSGISFNSSNPFVMQNGQLAWGTNQGAIFFEPEAIKEIPGSSGRIFFQDLTISGRSVRKSEYFNLKNPIDSIESLELNYSWNNLSLELLPLKTPPGSKFSWKLEGFSSDWTTPLNNRIITYTNLPSGKFDLKIRLYDSSLSRIIDERQISLKLNPPFWKTIWFYIVVALAVSGLILMYFLYYINNLKQIHTEEKVRFFTNTAHDIRTSITLIKAPVEELNREKNLSEAGRNYLRLAIEQARRLSSVVTQLMDFQKLDIGKEKLNLSMTDITALISNRIVMFKTFASSKKIKLIFNSDRDWYNSAVDEIKIEKVIDNLISNAVKYSHTNSQVIINLKCEDKGWELEVKDFGIGISRKAQRMLFKEFYRGDNAANTKIVGSGIGLLLVKNYVNMHNGNIVFESQENEGTTFKITIPYKKIESKKGSVHEELKKSEDKTNVNITETIQVQTKAEIIDSNKIKILIVEDNNELLNFMHDTLKAIFKTDIAVDGIQAWNFISKQTPDLVVSDIMMPNMDGFELCRKIKSTYETSHIPVILLTALSEKTEQLHGLGLGADDYLTKPFDMNLLIQKIKTIIRNREVVREKALKLIDGNIKEPVFTNNLNDQFVKKILEVAKTNISNTEFNKDMFAAAMNMSPSLLYKKIKSFTNLSPTDFIKSVRIKRSLELLKTRNYTVTEVSELCGFASVAYFSTVFRKFYGKSPTEFLK